MSQIEAVFFDCDGTLVDSEVICSRAPRICNDVSGIWYYARS